MLGAQEWHQVSLLPLGPSQPCTASFLSSDSCKEPISTSESLCKAGVRKAGSQFCHECQQGSLKGAYISRARS